MLILIIFLNILFISNGNLNQTIANNNQSQLLDSSESDSSTLELIALAEELLNSNYTILDDSNINLNNSLNSTTTETTTTFEKTTNSLNKPNNLTTTNLTTKTITIQASATAYYSLILKNTTTPIPQTTTKKNDINSIELYKDREILDKANCKQNL